MSEDAWASCDRDAALRDGIAAANAFGLPWPREMSGRGGGDVGGIGTGSSIDFHDQRSYVPGDDPRHINWSAYARTGTYTMKLFREEVQPAVDVVVDTSVSMGYSPEKVARTLSTVAFLAHAAQRATAAVWFYEANPSSGTSPRRWTAGEVLAGGWPGEAGQVLSGPPDLASIPFRNRSVRVLVSDLLYPGDPSPALVPLGHAAGAAAILAPSSDAERAPDWSGGCDFSEVETGESFATWCDGAFMRRYREAYQGHFSVWADAARRSQVALARIRAEGALTTALGVEALPAGAVSATR